MATAPDTSMAVIPMNDDAIIAPLPLSPSIAHLDDLVKIAKLAKASSLCNIKSESDALVILMTGVELGLQPMQALQGIYAVNNRPTLSAQMMAAVIQRSPYCKLFMVRESTDELCVVEVQRKGWPESQTYSFSKQDAVIARLWGKAGPWSQYPTDMLRSRAISRAARAAFSDCLLGLYTPEEAEQIGREEREHLEVVSDEPVPRRSKKDADPEEQFEERVRPALPEISDPAVAHEINRFKQLLTESKDDGLTGEQAKVYVEHVCELFDVERLSHLDGAQLRHVNGKLGALMPDERAGYMLKVTEGAADDVILPLPGQAEEEAAHKTAQDAFFAVAGEPYGKGSFGTKTLAEDYRQARMRQIASHRGEAVTSFKQLTSEELRREAQTLRVMSDLGERYGFMKDVIREWPEVTE